MLYKYKTLKSSFVFPPQGDCEDHASLLCSLLLGFGLEAYVCVGTKAKGTPHTWVLTRGTDGSITFWESLKAHRSQFSFYLFIYTFIYILYSYFYWDNLYNKAVFAASLWHQTRIATAARMYEKMHHLIYMNVFESFNKGCLSIFKKNLKPKL